MLESEGRPAQAANMGFRMLTLGLKSDRVGSEMIELGRRCLKMFVMTNNTVMTGNCLIIVTMLLIKHFENEAETEVKLLYHDNIANVSPDVSDFMKKIVHALEDGDYSRIDEIKAEYSKIKSDKVTKSLVGTVMNEIINNNEKEKETNMKLTEVNLDSRPKPLNIEFSKVLAVATGAAVVASSVAGMKYDKHYHR